jgi:hypothetical protein
MEKELEAEQKPPDVTESPTEPSLSSINCNMIDINRSDENLSPLGNMHRSCGCGLVAYPID